MKICVNGNSVYPHLHMDLSHFIFWCFCKWQPTNFDTLVLLVLLMMLLQLLLLLLGLWLAVEWGLRSPYPIQFIADPLLWVAILFFPFLSLPSLYPFKFFSLLPSFIFLFSFFLPLLSPYPFVWGRQKKGGGEAIRPPPWFPTRRVASFFVLFFFFTFLPSPASSLFHIPLSLLLFYIIFSFSPFSSNTLYFIPFLYLGAVEKKGA